MRGNTLRRILVALIIITPIFSYTDCKRQAKCGCGKDVVSTLSRASAYIYFTVGETIKAMVVDDPYGSTYTFCNPSEMFKNLVDAKSGDILLLSGHVYYDCNYVYQTSNSSYQSMARGYDIEATELYIDLYGKNKPANGTPLNPTTSQK